jgi:hypothetical protein
VSASFQRIRRPIADVIEPRSWGVGTTTSAGGADSVVSTQLAMTLGDTNLLNGGTIYFVDGTRAGESRPVVKNGLNISTGTASMASSYSGATPSGAVFEYHLRFPVVRTPGILHVVSYLDLINDALSRLWFEDLIGVSAVSSQKVYALDIATHPWLSDQPKRRVLEILGPADPTTSEKPRYSGRWEIDDDAEAPSLVLYDGGWSTGETFYLRCARPCNTRIKIGGTWTNVTPSALNSGQFGLASESDECHANPNDVLAMAVGYSFGALAMTQPMADRKDWEALRLYWTGVASRLKYARLPRRSDGRARLMAVGVGGGMMGGW